MKWLAALLFAMCVSIASAQTPPPQPKMDELLRLLSDPELKAWMESQKAATTVPKPEVAEQPGLSAWELVTRLRIDSIVSAIPRIPTEVAAASRKTRNDAISRGYAPVMLIFAGLVAIGSFAEWAFRRLLRGRLDIEDGAEKSVISQLLPVSVFAATMGVIFFAVEWPPLARIVLLTYLIGFVVYRCLSVLVSLCTEGHAPLRRRARLFLGGAVIAISSATLAGPLGVDSAVSEAISYSFSIVLLAIAIEAVWSDINASPRIESGAHPVSIGDLDSMVHRSQGTVLDRHLCIGPARTIARCRQGGGDHLG
ncbi:MULTISPECIES: hypothetical protein [unclassified Rhizobium]|uniref:hypothetical protein n=1 Tax=unclassified Rhizobium TaxID=2613769 RepID=UPI0027DCCA98|nr:MULTISPECIES: hypothetical protein [unclassified Rhizobium]